MKAVINFYFLANLLMQPVWRNAFSILETQKTVGICMKNILKEKKCQTQWNFKHLHPETSIQGPYIHR